MEQRFFDAISDEQQDKAGSMVEALKREARDRAESGKTRDHIKGSYARQLAARLAKVKA